jgi:hypothetical protein
LPAECRPPSKLIPDIHQTRSFADMVKDLHGARCSTYES